jgi:hypothetical protein
VGEAQDIAAASQPIPRRAWRDFRQRIRGHGFNLLLAVLTVLGGAAGAIAPADASTAEKALTTVLAGLAAIVLSYLLALLWSLCRAPFRQRSELIELHNPDDKPQPILVMKPAIEIREEKGISFGGTSGPGRCFVAFIRVFNAQEQGGPAATAEHVTPELKVFNGAGETIYERKGWDEGLVSRQFTTSQEEHALWLAAKWERRSGCDLIEEKKAKRVKALSDGASRGSTHPAQLPSRSPHHRPVRPLQQGTGRTPAVGGGGGLTGEGFG